MKLFRAFWSREPVMILGLLEGVIAFGAAFGFELTGKQTAAVTGLALVVIGFVKRRTVSSPATVKRLTTEALAAVV